MIVDRVPLSRVNWTLLHHLDVSYSLKFHNTHGVLKQLHHASGWGFVGGVVLQLCFVLKSAHARAASGNFGC